MSSRLQGRYVVYLEKVSHFIIIDLVKSSSVYILYYIYLYYVIASTWWFYFVCEYLIWKKRKIIKTGKNSVAPPFYFYYVKKTSRKNENLSISQRTLQKKPKLFSRVFFIFFPRSSSIYYSQVQRPLAEHFVSEFTYPFSFPLYIFLLSQIYR